MKILLSAYHCKPDTGSEAGLGWSWATELARSGHEVWVITSTACEPKVKQAMQLNPISNLHFIYFDKRPTWFTWWSKLAVASHKSLLLSFVYHLLYQLVSVWWQWNAYRKIAKPLIQQIAFDWVHHVTTGTVRRPSFMGLLGVSFILGPLGGGENTPWRLRKSYPLRGWLFELVRDASNYWVRLDPLMHLTFAKASTIYCTSQQTQALLPRRYRYKSQVQLAMGLETNELPQTSPQRSTETTFRILFVGRFLYWKGLHLGLRAFAQLRQEIPNSRLTAIGNGPDEKWLHGLAKQLGVYDAVDWIRWLKERRELMSIYLQHDVLLFPSLHESGGTVILEAFCHGLPVLCLDLGGPGVMVDETCGRVIRTDGLGEEAVIQGLCDALTQLARHPDLRTHLSKGALARTSEFTRKKAVARVYPELAINQGEFNQVISTK